MSEAAKLVDPRDEQFVRTRDIDGASFLLCDAPRPSSCGVHTHKKVVVSFLLQGSIIEVDENSAKVECGAFTLHSTPPALRHAHLIRSERISTLCFTLEEHLLSKMGDAAAAFERPITSRRASVISLAPKFQREILATDSASDLVLQGLIFELAGELSRPSAPKLAPEAPLWLRRAKEMLHDLWNQNVSIEDIASAVGVHPSHLNRVFRTYMNQTPGEYLRALRMERATREVLTSDLPLKAVAARAGFSDQAHFTREFRRHHGASPLEMRRTMKSEPLTG